MLKKANPNSRIPAFLQPHTKENAIFQISVTAAFILVMTAKDLYQIHLERKKREEIRAWSAEEIKKLEILGSHSEDIQDWREAIHKKLDDLGPLEPGI